MTSRRMRRLARDGRRSRRGWTRTNWLRPPAARGQRIATGSAPALLGLAGLAFIAGAIVLLFVALSGGGDRTVTLASGLRFTETAKGSGDPPHPGDALTMHYTGTLEDGTVFDSSRG